MREKDIVDYLFKHPEILFPDKEIQEKTREYYIKGKRIDILFVVDGIRVIVEVKAVPIQREHVGQVAEYYGLMLEYFSEANLRMLLVSPSIPQFRSAYLEKIGIQCVELPNIPEQYKEISVIKENSAKYMKQQNANSELLKNLKSDDSFTIDVMCRGESIITNKKSLALINCVVKDLLPNLSKDFNDYEIVPFIAKSAFSGDYDFEYYKEEGYGLKEFQRGRTWFAFRYGFLDEMPPNDVPNISIIFNSQGCDITINAEIQSSQKIFLNKIRFEKSAFNLLLKRHGNLWLKTYLKFEHKPRKYHWILTDFVPPLKFDADTIISTYESHNVQFTQKRTKWLQYIEHNNLDMTPKQINHMNKQNQRLNFAIRLVAPINHKNKFWDMGRSEQLSFFNDQILGLKPFIDFFVN